MDTTLELKNAVQDLQQRAIGRVNEVETKQREIADRLWSLEQRGTAGPTLPGGGIVHKSIGSQVAEAIVAELPAIEKHGRTRFTIKAAGDPVLTGSVGTIATLGPLLTPAAVTGIAAVLPMPSTPNSTQVKYSRYTGLEGGAAVQAGEGTAKAKITPNFTLITQDAITLAGLTKVSRQALADQNELTRTVNNVIGRQLYLALDALLVNGGTGFATGYEGLATSYTSLVYQGMADAVSEGVSTMQLAGFSPNAVLLNPADWLAITVAKALGSGEYLSGSYLQALPQALRGLSVGLSGNVDAGKALLMDTAFLECVVMQNMTFEIGLDGDDFSKNLATILGEMRVAPIFLATGAARLITPKA
jgi:hypothetical protein